jgi:hypothetical protein
MVYRQPRIAPASSLPVERRGPVVGRFCKACGEVYPLQRRSHTGKPLYGKDHVASPCPHHGEEFAAGEDWWQDAVAIIG